jgi:5-methylthioadenosine/S-adenosylhomocysteine deaminase
MKNTSLLIKNAIHNSQSTDLLIENNLITQIKKNINFPAEKIIDCQNSKAVLPGFINSHTHSAMSYFRGFGEGLPLERWLTEKIWPKEALLTKDDIYWGTLFSFIEMIKSGITTINEMYSNRESQIEALQTLPMRAQVGLVIFDNSDESSPQETIKILEKYQNSLPANIQFSLAPHSIYTVSKSNLEWVGEFARKTKLPIHIHLAETKIEVENCLDKYQKRPVEFLESINFFTNNQVSIAHAVHLSDNELKILEKRNVNLIYNPNSNLKLNSGIFDFQQAKKYSLNITLGTDGVSSNNSLNFFDEMKSAFLSQNALNLSKNQSNFDLTTRDIYQSATINGAKSLNINSGEIEEGKLADLILLDRNHLSLIPNHNLISNLIFSATPECVSDVIINGQVVMENRFIKLEEKIKNEFKKRLKRLFEDEK